MSALRRWWTNFTASVAERDAELLRADATLAGAQVIENVVSGQVTTLSGTVQSLVFRPEVNVPVLEAELFDGSGHIVLRWLGRRTIRGINPGVTLRVTGRLVNCDHRLMMFNPNYAIVAKGAVE